MKKNILFSLYISIAWPALGTELQQTTVTIPKKDTVTIQLNSGEQKEFSRFEVEKIPLFNVFLTEQHANIEDSDNNTLFLPDENVTFDDIETVMNTLKSKKLPKRETPQDLFNFFEIFNFLAPVYHANEMTLETIAKIHKLFGPHFIQDPNYFRDLVEKTNNPEELSHDYFENIFHNKKTLVAAIKSLQKLHKYEELNGKDPVFQSLSISPALYNTAGYELPQIEDHRLWLAKLNLNTLNGFKKIYPQQDLVNITSLNLGNNQLTELPPKIFAPLTQLEELHLENNKFPQE